MKSLIVLATLATMASVSIFSTAAQAQAKPDLRVSAIATPGGICKAKKVRVTVTNSQQVGVNEDIPVIIFVNQPPNGATSYVGVLNNGIGPNANSGNPVWFSSMHGHNIAIDVNGGPVEIRAVVNPDLEVEESVYNNNDKVQTFNCTPPNLSPTATINPDKLKWSIAFLNVYKKPIIGARISMGNYTGTTDRNGEIVVKGPKPGSRLPYKIEKKGCQSSSASIRLSRNGGSQPVSVRTKCS